MRMSRIYKIKVLAILFVTALMVLLQTQAIYALSPDQKTIYSEGINYFDVQAQACGGSSDSPATTSGSASSGSDSFTLDQVKTFASEAVTSTWNISDSTVEQWFLKQAGAQPTIARYGLNSSNIGQITSAVKAANVSPVFFYLYTVNEGGGAGGFINHYGSSTGQGGAADAKRDAEYLASQSKDKSAGPATGGGEPSDMPTAEAKQILSALPSGSIGVVYIQATSAVTAELEYLSGKTGDWNPQDSPSPATIFGSPLEEEMKNIRAMGGDPQQGGATVSTGGGCTSSGVASASCGGSGKYSALVSSGSSFAGVDQGIDFVPSGSRGYNICAPAPGTITLADQTGHHFDRTSGQAEIIEKLDQTPNAPSSSQYIYYAEIIQINSNINVGTHVNAGDTIGTNSQSPGIEVGWGQSSTEGFKCPIGYPTACGTSFDSWVQGISAGKGP
jgi:hypothetical protein